MAINGVLRENNTGMDLTQIRNVNEAEDAFAKAIKARVKKKIIKAQKQLRADIFGFGPEIHLSHPKQWKTMEHQWETIFPEVAVNIETKVTIARTGMTGIPAQLREDEVIKE